MRCMGCGGEMILMNVVPDDTMAVPGFEHHSFMCSECQDMEQRLVFTKYGREEAPEGMPIHAAPPIAPGPTLADTQIAAPGLFGRVLARIRRY
jgi:hypothetical protein